MESTGLSKKRRLSGSPQPKSPGADHNSLFDKDEDEIFASTYKREDLDSLRVFYDRDPMPVGNFFEMVKQKKNRPQWKYPEEAKLFVKMTKDHLRFNLDLEKVLKVKDFPAYLRGAKPYIYEREMLEELNDTINEFHEFQLKELNEKLHPQNSDKFYITLFLFWSSKMVDFLFHCKDLIQKLNFPQDFSLYDNNKEEKHGKSGSIFVETFRKFSEVFFLLPIPYRKTYGVLKNVPVSSEPDLSFLEPSKQHLVGPLLVMFSEVARYEIRKPDDEKETWIEGRLSSASIGRVAAELLNECNFSSFSPNVLGIACMRTEIIFLFLEITEDHIIDLQNDNPSLEERHASIHYTKKYDIMKAEDRDELTEMLFYLGCLQKDSLHKYFLRQ